MIVVNCYLGIGVAVMRVLTVGFFSLFPERAPSLAIWLIADKRSLGGSPWQLARMRPC